MRARNDQLESESTKLDLIYNWLKPADHDDMLLPVKLKFDQIIDTKRSRDSNYKKNHRNFIINALANPSNESLNMVCLEIANAMK